jgi:hypothetical protein
MLAPMRFAATAAILALAFIVGGCGGDSTDTSSTTTPRPKPKINIGGVKADSLRKSGFVSCLERAGFKVTIRPDRARSRGIADLYFYDLGDRTPEQDEKLDRCSAQLIEPLREREDDLGVAIPEIKHVKPNKPLKDR